MRILYDSKDIAFKKPFGTLRECQECEMNIHIPKKCGAKSVEVQFLKEDGGNFAAFFFYKADETEDYDIYKVSFAISLAGLYFYRFYIEDKNGQYPLYKEGYNDTNIGAGELWQLSCVPKNFKVPYDFMGKVMYQIFPDRFFKWKNCNTINKITPFTLHENLSDIPEYRPDETGEVLNNDFFGGNLKGIEKKLPYLKKLGVSVIYLNPIFKAFSNHRYDTADYKKIDDLLGNEKDFVSLTKKAHKLGISIILDGVFSHTGSRSVYFEDAVKNENSPYKDWFQFENYPDKYTSWWGIETLPCVNEMNENYLDFIINDEDSVIARYLKLGADGWRLDVADELPDEFISRLRARMKEVKPDSLLIGEVWEDASNKCSYGKRRKYFVGGELDSVMNYPFRKAICDFVLGFDDGEDLRKTVMTVCENYPSDVVLCLMNMLSTHDTPRILSVLSGETPPSTKEERAEHKMSEETLKTATKRLKCASFLQFVLPGMPSIYYGDEIGSEGFEDPFCRRFFDWEKEKESKLKAFFESLCEMRNKSDVLKFGTTKVSFISNGFIKIEREHSGKKICCYVNCSKNDVTVNNANTIFAENTKISGDTAVIGQYGFILS